MASLPRLFTWTLAFALHAACVEPPDCLKATMIMDTLYEDGPARRLVVVHADFQEQRLREDYFDMGEDAALSAPIRHHSAISDHHRGEQALLMRRNRRAHAFAPASCVIVPLSGSTMPMDLATFASQLQYAGQTAIAREDLVLMPVTAVGEPVEPQKRTPLSRWRWIPPARANANTESDPNAKPKAPQEVILSVGIPSEQAAATLLESLPEVGTRQTIDGLPAQVGLPHPATPAAARPSYADGARPPTASELIDNLVLVSVPALRTNYTVISIDGPIDCGAVGDLFEPEDDTFTLGGVEADDEASDSGGRVRCTPASAFGLRTFTRSA